MSAMLYPVSRRIALFGLVAPLLLAACDPRVGTAPQAAPEPGLPEATNVGPAGAPDGTCWGKTVTPAVVESVVRQVQVTPTQINADGTIAAVPEYRTETTQEIVTARRDNWFQTPCADVLTPDFIATLQRALAARGLYPGEANGVLDAPTRRAVQNFQRSFGPDSGVLSLAAARQLGLIAVPRGVTQ